MPKKVPRNNPAGRSHRTVQSAASLLQRINRTPGGPQDLPQLAAPAAIERLRQLLPEELRPHLREVLEKPGELVLFADSAVWAARLKLAASALAGVADGRRQVVRLIPRGGFRK